MDFRNSDLGTRLYIKALKRCQKRFQVVPFASFFDLLETHKALEHPSSTMLRDDLAWHGNALCAGLAGMSPLFPSYVSSSC